MMINPYPSFGKKNNLTMTVTPKMLSIACPAIDIRSCAIKPMTEPLPYVTENIELELLKVELLLGPLKQQYLQATRLAIKTIRFYSDERSLTSCL